MRHSKKLILIAIFLIGCINSYGQCAMCRAVLESSETGTIKAEALNNGIVYLMAFPYILVGILGIVIYKTNQKRKKDKKL